MNALVEKVSNMTISTSPLTVPDDAVVPNITQPTYVDIQPTMSVSIYLLFFFSIEFLCKKKIENNFTECF